MIQIIFLIALTVSGGFGFESSREEANRMVETHRQEDLDPGSLQHADIRDASSNSGNRSSEEGVSGALVAGSTIGSGTAAAVLLFLLRILYEIYQRRAQIVTALDFFILFLEILTSYLRRCRPRPIEPALPIDIPLRYIGPVRDV